MLTTRKEYMHNKILFPLSIAAVAFGIVALNVPSVSAKETKNGIDYWSVKEMMAIKTEVEKEESDACGDDYFCRQDWSYEQLDSNNKYRALENFQMDKLIPTLINPSTNTIKLFYQNEDSMLTHMLGRPQESQIEDFYMLWVEEQLGNPLQNGSWLTYGERYPYFLGDHASVESASHLMIDEDKDRNGANWFTPNVEREYTITNSNLSDNTVRRFYYSLLEENGGRTNGVKDYSSCFDADYHEGMECRYMYGEDGSSRYFPFEPVSNNPEPNVDGKSETASNSDDYAESISSTLDEQTAKTAKKESSKSIVNKDNKAKEKEAIIASQSEKITVSKPVILQTDQKNSEQHDGQPTESGSINTSANTSENNDEVTQPLGISDIELPKTGGCEREIIFPWWFIILVLICDFLLMWFFWPKKSEKRVDKRVNQR